MSDGSATRRFDASAFSQETATALRKALEEGSYRDAQRLPQPGRLGLQEVAVFRDFVKRKSNCWGYSSFDGYYRRRLESEKGTRPLLLFDLFWLKRSIREDQFLECFDAETLKALCDGSVLSREGDEVRSNVRIIAVRDLFALFDVDRTREGFVYFGTDSQDMVTILGRESKGLRFERSLDMCTGSGVQGLSVAGQAEEVICADINERALSIVGANASLNGLNNVRTVYSDMFTNITGKFDSITANTPYVPMPDDPEAHDLPMRGGDLGTEFTFAMLDQLPDYFSSKVVAVIYTSDPILVDHAYLPREVERRYGRAPLEFTQLSIFRSYPRTERQRQHFQKHNLVAFDDCVLVIRNAPQFSYKKKAWTSHYWRSSLLRTGFSSDPASESEQLRV